MTLSPVVPPDAHRTARVAGALYLCLIPLGIFSFAYVPARLMIAGDPAATARNLAASEHLFRLAIVSHLVSQLIVVGLALALYRLLRPVGRHVAASMVSLALVCVAVSFVSEVHNLAVLRMLDGSFAEAFAPAQLHAQIALQLDLYRSNVLLAQVFWGLWLIVLSRLVYRAVFLPRWLAVPLVAAAAGYLVDSGAHLLGAEQSAISPLTAGFELVLPLWLLVRGAGSGVPPEATGRPP